MIGTNHKGHTELVFHGLSMTKKREREIYHLFDGSTDQQEQTHAWNPLMKKCDRKTNDWRTYTAVVWNDLRDYDRSK